MGFHTVLTVPRSQDLELKEKIEALAAEAGACRILVSPSPMKGVQGMSKDWCLASIRWNYRQRLILWSP